MRRIIRYKPLAYAVAVAFVAGCSGSSRLDVADRSNATGGHNDVALPDSEEAVDLATGEKVAAPASLAEQSLASNPDWKPEPVEIADGADSDIPGGHAARATEQANGESREESLPLDQAAGGEEGSKLNGRAPDGDDPKAPLVIAKIAEQQDDAPLEDGREPAATPIPEGQRVAVASKSVEPDASELGRDPLAKPGAESPKVTPTTKPVAPSRKTLADLSEAVQALDKDGDGQLGLYEWPREKLAEFKTLDSNKDGFLTPAELVAGQKKASDAEAAKTEREPAADSEEKVQDQAKDKAASQTDDSSNQDDATAPAADTTDEAETKAETPDSSSDAADSNDESSVDDQPTPGS